MLEACRFGHSSRAHKLYLVCAARHRAQGRQCTASHDVPRIFHCLRIAERADLKLGSRKGKREGYVDRHAGADAPGQRKGWLREDVDSAESALGGGASALAELVRRERETGTSRAYMCATRT